MRRLVTVGVLFALVAFVVPAIPASAATAATVITAPPGAPTKVTASGGTVAATVSWQPAGQPASSFTVTSIPGGITASVDGIATSATVSGLGYGLSYTFSVTGTNSSGTGSPSAPSNAVTPDPPGGPYHQGFAIVLINRDITAGSPFATNLGDDPVHLPGLSAVVLNLTASLATVATTVQVVVNQQVVQSVSVIPGQVQSSLVVVAVPAQLSQGAIQVTSGRAHVQVDFVGYFTGPKTLRDHSGMLEMIRPATLLNASVATGSTTNVPVLGQGDVPTAHVAEVLVNVTATSGAGAGAVTLLPSGGFATGITTLGFGAGQTTANRAIVALPANGAISVVDRGAAVGVRVDVLGWFTDGTDPSALGSLYNAVSPFRLVDTSKQAGPVPAGSTMTFAVSGYGGAPAVTSAAPPTSVMLVVTAVAPAGAGSISASGLAVVNFVAGQTLSGLALVHLANDGSATLTVTGAATNFTVDLVAYFSGDLIVPGSTKVLTPAALAGITSLGADLSITFAPGTQFSPPIQLNDVINAGISPTTPKGFLRRVLSIGTLPGGEVVLGTRRALLTEALTAFTLDWVLPPTSGARFGARSNSARSTEAMSAPVASAPPITSIDPNYPVLAIATASHPITATIGSGADISLKDLEVQVLPTIHLEYNFWTNTVKAAFGFSEGVRLALELSVTRDIIAINFQVPRTNVTIPLGAEIPIPIGPIVVIITPVLVFAVTVDLNINVGLSITYHFDKFVQVTESYDGSQFQASKFSKEYQNKLDPPEASANAEMKVASHMSPGIEFYDLPFFSALVDLNFYEKYSASVTCSTFPIPPSCGPAAPWWTFSVGACVGVAMNLDLFIIKKLFSKDLLCVEIVLAHAPGLRLDIVMVPPTATVARFKVQHFHAAVTNSPQGVTWSVAGGSAPGTLSNTSVTDADYTASGTAGTYTVKARAIEDPTSFNMATITVNPDPPAAPSGVTASVAGLDSATVSWTAPSDDGGAPITAYHVLVSPGGAQVDTGNTLSVTVPGLTAATTYTFQVTATNKAGTSAPSVASAPITIGFGAPGPPTAVSAVPVIVTTVLGSAVVSWTAPTSDGGSPITAYHVLVSLAGGQVDTGLGIGTGNALSVTVTNLNAASTYTFQVSATNQAGLTSVPSVASAPITIPIPDIVIVTPANFDYGLVPAGQSSVQTFTVHASSTAAITISSLLFNSGRPADFAIQADNCTAQVVLAGGTCTFQVVFTPRPQGYSFVTVLVYYDDPINVVSAFLRGHSPLPLIGGFEPLSDAQMLDLQHGWAMDAQYGVVATVDGGKTWTRHLAPAGASFQYYFHFGDSTHGLALGCTATGPGRCTSFDVGILGTSDGGATWNLVGSIPNLEASGIFMADATHAWAFGNDNSFHAAIYATADGGLTWNRQDMPDPAVTTCASVAGGIVSSGVPAVRFIDAQHGWAFGSSECQAPDSTLVSAFTLVWSTSDGGATWTAHDTGLNTFLVFSGPRLQVVSATQIRVALTINDASPRPVLLTTDDGGATFSQLSLPALPIDLSYVDASHAVLLTDRHAWTSSDGGTTWTETLTQLPITVPTLNNDLAYFRLVEAVDADHWWIFGEVVYGDGSPVGGLIEATADAGTSWLVQLVGDGTFPVP